MKLNEEAIGGREGYLQRLISKGEDSLRGVSAPRLAGEEYNPEHGGESGGPDRTGERYGTEPSGYPGDSGRRVRPNNTRQLAVELLKIREP